jgi:ankyrin repeat protein
MKSSFLAGRENFNKPLISNESLLLYSQGQYFYPCSGTKIHHSSTPGAHVPLHLLAAPTNRGDKNISQKAIIPRNNIFYKAVLTENFQWIESLLQPSDKSPLTRNYFGENLISEAIGLNKISVIHYLLKKGIKIPSNHDKDIVALQSKLVFLEDYGSLYRIGKLKINEVDPIQGGAPIHLGMTYNNMDMTKFLLLCRADVNNCDSAGNSPLHLAVLCANEQIVKLLLENKANPEIANKQNLTVLNLLEIMPLSVQLDLIRQHIERGPILFEEVDAIQKAYEEGQWMNNKILGSDLIIATHRQDIHCVQLLLNFITVDNIAGAFIQAVHVAIENGNLDLVKLFFQKCRNIAIFLQAFDNSETPIAHAIRANKEDIISFLAKQSYNTSNMKCHNNPRSLVGHDASEELIEDADYSIDIMPEIESWLC